MIGLAAMIFAMVSLLFGFVGTSGLERTIYGCAIAIFIALDHIADAIKERR